jgi:hypothetical protein
VVQIQIPSEPPPSLFTTVEDGPGWAILIYFRITEVNQVIKQNLDTVNCNEADKNSGAIQCTFQGFDSEQNNELRVMRVMIAQSQWAQIAVDSVSHDRYLLQLFQMTDNITSSE